MNMNFDVIVAILIAGTFVALAIIMVAQSQKSENARRIAQKQRRIEEEEEKERKAKEHLEWVENLKKSPEDYFKYVLCQDFSVLDGVDISGKIEMIYGKDGMLGVDFELPTKNEVRRAHQHNFLTKSGTVRKDFETKHFPEIYERTLYTLCLRSLDTLFAFDEDGRLESALFNGHVTDYSPTTGKLERRLILSVVVSKEQFQGLDIEHVEPKACFKALKGVSAAKLIDMSPVTPVLFLNKSDRRFIEGRNVEVSSGTNLASMDWRDFEQFVRKLLELECAKNGGEVKVTQASRDGGVDAVMFDPDPLRGGRIVVQAKRYTNTVPVSAVRDLYGTVINEGANSGVLITTSDYGSDSYDFAKGKPLKLLNGGHLLAMLQEHGRQGYINIAEAREINKLREKE